MNRGEPAGPVRPERTPVCGAENLAPPPAVPGPPIVGCAVLRFVDDARRELESVSECHEVTDPLVVRHTAIFGHGHGQQPAIIDASRHHEPPNVES